MTKLATIQSRVSSIFRKRKVAPKKNKDDVVNGSVLKEDEDTVKIEESESDITLNDSLSFLFASTTVVTKPKKKSCRVTFTDVSIRHYNLIVGDNPYCRFPLSLGWNYGKEETHKVDLFEVQRDEQKHERIRERIHPRLYVPPTLPYHYLSDVHTEQDYDDSDERPTELTLHERRARLRAFGYTEAALRKAERQRIVALGLEWKDGGTPHFPFSQHFITRYTK